MHNMSSRTFTIHIAMTRNDLIRADRLLFRRIQGHAGLRRLYRWIVPAADGFVPFRLRIIQRLVRRDRRDAQPATSAAQPSLSDRELSYIRTEEDENNVVGDPLFRNETSGSNRSDEDDIVSSPSNDFTGNFTFKYLLPIGDGRATPSIPTACRKACSIPP